jgi:AraC-like DNA-binding protein
VARMAGAWRFSAVGPQRCELYINTGKWYNNNSLAKDQLYGIAATPIMRISALIPTEVLRPFILTYLIIDSPEEGVNKVLPDTSLVMSLHYKGSVSCVADNTEINLPSSSISGLRRSMRSFHYSKGTGNILVLFKEAGAAAFFKNPLHHLFNETVALDQFIPHRDVAIIEEQIAGAKNDAQIIHRIEKFLISALYDHTPDKLISAALQKIHAAKGVIKIKELADALYISQDAFEKRFRRAVGTSPKQFSSIVLMRSVTSCRLLKQRLSDIAFDAGYCDQPHFNKDFRLFTGQTPSDFYKSPSPLAITDFIQ